MQNTVKSEGKTIWITLAVVVAIILVFVLSISSAYNKAITYDEAVKNAWGQVENQLTRRFDLIPNLVNTVKGYAKHEKELFTHLADARTKYFNAKGPAAKAKAASHLEGFLSRLLVLQERYPDLKANEGFLKLQDQLEGTENRIAVERKRYNDAVKALNIYARGLFSRMACSIAGVGKAEYFEAPEEKKENPKVEF